MFLDMLGLYKAVSTIISDTIARDGQLCCAWDNFPTERERHRPHRDQHAADPWIAYNQEGYPAADRDVHQEGRKRRGNQLELDSSAPRGGLARLLAQRTHSSRRGGAQRDGHHHWKAGRESHIRNFAPKCAKYR